MKRFSIENNEHLCIERHIIANDFPIHWHKFFEIEIITGGSGTQIINDKEYNIYKKHVLLVTPTDFHSVKSGRNIKLINISFDSNMISEKNLATIVSSKIKKDYVLSDDEYKNITYAVSLLEHEIKVNGDCQKQLLEYILSIIFRKNDKEYLSDLYYSNTEICAGVKKAIIFMELNFRENITMKMIAQEAGYNPTYFSEIFKKTTGESYIKTLTRLRLNHAKALLKNDCSVKDACFLSGFNSLSNFYVSFKSNFGMSPSDYVKKKNAK